MLKEGQTAPDFKLPLFEVGETTLTADPRMTLLIFYKYNCPTCQLTLPYIQQIFQAYGESIRFLALAQDDRAKTAAFRQEYGITLPTALDDTPYRVSRQYDIESVPSLFLINPDRTIRYAGDGFVKQDLLNLADVMAEKSALPQIDVFGNDPVPAMKPG